VDTPERWKNINRQKYQYNIITDMMQEIILFFREEKRNLVFPLIRLQNQQTPTTHNPI